MRDNSLCLQILTIAHVYGHNDFFASNFTFTSATQARETLGSFKTRADRVRGYIEDPSIGSDAVEAYLDAAHALSFNRSRNQAIRKLDNRAQRERLIDIARPREDEFSVVHKREEVKLPDLTRIPLQPEADILLFIRDHHREIAGWQKDLLTIVDEEARYFLPQIETKIMNEGWASHWHHRIMNAIDLPQELYLEFLVRHNQVVCPHPGGINPYHVGYVIWRDIEKRFGGEGTAEGRAKMFQVRESDRDVAFLRRFLTAELCRELDLFTWRPRGEHLVVDQVSDEESWEEIRNALLRQVATGGMPSLKIKDADYKGARGLYLIHEHDGRDLDIANAEKTLGHLRFLWGGKVFLETRLKNKPALLSEGPDGFDAKLLV
jgi:stage V sporulation protein R